MNAPHPYVRARIKNDYWLHRGAWMEYLLRSIESFFKEHFGASLPILVVTGTRLAGAEALVANTVAPGERVWTTRGSLFKEPLTQCGARLSLIREGEKLPDETPIAVFFGTVPNARRFAAAIRKKYPHALMFADISETFGKIRTDYPSAAFDGYVVSPVEMGGVPGTVVLALNARARACMRAQRERLPQKPYTFDLLKYAASWEKHSTPYSPDISACVALDAAIRLIRENGGLYRYMAKKTALKEPLEAILPKSVFTMTPELFIVEAARNAARKSASLQYLHKIAEGARAMFTYPRDYRTNNCYKDRTIGFIGAGNVVRESLWRAKKLGIDNIIVYSPTLAQSGARGKASDHRNAAYWKTRGAVVASSYREVFLKAHTVVLLPTFHTPTSIALLNKRKAHINEHIVNGALLDEVEREGRMDLLINSSARDRLLDRRALAHHLRKGWLTYISDELPQEDDPVLPFPNAVFTGHVGGSCPPTQKRVAINTRMIIQELIRAMRSGRALKRMSRHGYKINLINEHLNKARGWRVGSVRTHMIRILLTDRFDKGTLALRALGRALGVRVVVRDIAKEPADETMLSKTIRTYRPHIIMVRTRTKISDTIARAIESVSECSAIVRPGVGIDNAYGGLRRLSKARVMVINEPFGNSYAVAEMTMHFVLHGVPRILLTPGPTRYDQRIFAAADDLAVGNEQCLRVEKEVRKELAGWTGLGEPLMLSTPATGLMEAAIANLTLPGDHGLIVSHGKFGDRFRDIALARGRTVTTLCKDDEEWGQGFSPAEVARAFRQSEKKISFLCLQQNETSSGVAYRERHLERIVQAARIHNPDIILIIDAVSGLFAHDLDFAKIGADAVVLGSQKGLGLSSGLSFISLSDRALSAMLDAVGYKGSSRRFSSDPHARRYAIAFGRTRKVHYLNLLRLFAEQGGKTRADTLPIFHILSAHRSLALMREEGGRRAIIGRHRALARLTRTLARRLPARLLTDKEYASDSVTPLYFPSADAPRIRSDLLGLYGILVAGAQKDYWKPSVLRVGHLGFVRRCDIVRCMRALYILSR